MLRHYENLKQWFETTFPRIDGYTRAHRRVIKYVISGCTAAATNIIFLFIFVHYFGIYYIFAAVISWILSFFVSFILQKFWTFSSRNLEKAHKELVIYFTVSITGLVVDTYLLYVFVEFLHIHYLISQIIIGLATAVVTFSINKFIIFKKHHPKGRHVILLAAAIYPPDAGGPATHAVKYEALFAGSGHEVRIVVFSRLLWLPAGIRHLAYALLILRKALGADIIYLQDLISAGPAAYVARLMRKKYIIRIGGDVVWERAAESGKTNKSCLEFYYTEGYEKFRFFSIAKSVLAHASYVIVTCELLRDIYVKNYGISEAKIAVIPNPIPASHMTAFCEPQKAVMCERSVIFASRLVKYKNLELVIQAFKDIDANFYVLGNGPEKQKLEDERLKLEWRDKVKILGTVGRTEKDEYLKKCMLTIAPALTEFNPNYVLEGFTFCKPTLMSRENGLPFKLPEIMLFDPRNKEEFVAKLTYLLSDTGYKEAQNCVKNLTFNQTWDDVIRKNLEIIEEVCAS